MLMVSYIESINLIKDISEKIDFNNGIKLYENLNKDNVLRIAIAGNNLKDNKDIINQYQYYNKNILLDTLKDYKNISPIYDGIIIILDAVQPVSRGDKELFFSLNKYYKDIIFVVKRMEYVDEDERQSVLEYIKEKIFNIANSHNVYLLNSLELKNYIENIDIKNTKYNNDSYKVKNIMKELKYILEEKINEIENWEFYKEKELSEVNNNIKKIYYYGEGFATYFNRMHNREFDFEYFLKDISYIYEKYIGKRLDGINDIKSIENLKDYLYTNLKSEIKELEQEKEKLVDGKKDYEKLDEFKLLIKKIESWES